MINKRARAGIAAVLGAMLLLSVGVSLTGPVEAQSRGNNLTGTWYFTTPTGLSGFRTYNQDGTMTGNTTVMFGGEPRNGVLRSSDYGRWRQVGNGFEVVAYRFAYDETTGDVDRIIRLRSLTELDRRRDSASGTFLVTQWVCLLPTTCPDPNVDPPTVPEFAPPGNTFTSSRVRFP